MTKRYSRRDFLKVGMVTVGSGLLIPGLSACMPAAAPAPEMEAEAEAAPPAEEKVAIFVQGKGNNYGSAPKTLWTGFRFWTNSGQPSRIMWEPIVDLDENLQPVPGLAESWEFVDTQTIQFKLRPGLQWSDGTPLTSQDVVYSMNMTFHADSRDLTAGELSLIKGGIEMMAGETDELAGVRAVDDNTFIIETSKPDTTLVLAMAHRWWAPIPQHIYGDIAPADLEQSPEMLQPTVGSGPYVMDRQETDKWFEFVPNDSYWRGRVPLDRIIYVYGDIGDLVALGTQERFHHSWVRDGEVASALEAMPAYSAIWKEYIQGYRMQFNLTKPKYQDPLFRKAVCYAIDRETLCNDIYKGFASPLYTDFFEDLLDPSAEVYRFDMDHARSLLAQSNWNSDDTVKFLRTTSSGAPNPTAEAELLAYQEWFTDLGVNFEFDTKPDGASYTASINEMDFDLFENPHRPYHIYGPLEMQNYLLSGEGVNFIGYDNPDVDVLIEEAFITYGTNYERYLEIAREMSVIVQDEAVYVPTKALMAANIVHEDFIGLTSISEAYLTYAQPYLWDLK